MLYFQTGDTAEQGIENNNPVNMIKYYVSKEAFFERRRFNVVEYYSRMEATILGMIPRG
jgi:hypothetical protein